VEKGAGRSWLDPQVEKGWRVEEKEVQGGGGWKHDSFVECGCQKWSKRFERRDKTSVWGGIEGCRSSGRSYYDRVWRLWKEFFSESEYDPSMRVGEEAQNNKFNVG